MNNNVYLSVWIAGFQGRGVQIRARRFRGREARRCGFLNCAIKAVYIRWQQA